MSIETRLKFSNVFPYHHACIQIQEISGNENLKKKTKQTITI